jgi:SAM-dependent methyltransferase
VTVEYAPPRLVSDVSECFFYHVMDLPGVGVVGGQWDLRDTVDDYLGRFDFRGKRALDVGTASGFLTFEMEKRSAREVVSFDLGPDVSWDIVPRGSPAAVAGQEAGKRQEGERLVNAYWFAHRLLGSSARAYHGNVYELPDALGPFDVVVLGAILLHLRDPFRALQSVSRLSTGAIIVTDLHFASDLPVMRFLPDGKSATDTWWLISDACMAAMLGVLGFTVRARILADHLAVHGGRAQRVTFSTHVATRDAR